MLFSCSSEMELELESCKRMKVEECGVEDVAGLAGARDGTVFTTVEEQKRATIAATQAAEAFLEGLAPAIAVNRAANDAKLSADLAADMPERLPPSSLCSLHSCPPTWSDLLGNCRFAAHLSDVLPDHPTPNQTSILRPLSRGLSAIAYGTNGELASQKQFEHDVYTDDSTGAEEQLAVRLALLCAYFDTWSPPQTARRGADRPHPAAVYLAPTREQCEAFASSLRELNTAPRIVVFGSWSDRQGIPHPSSLSDSILCSTPAGLLGCVSQGGAVLAHATIIVLDYAEEVITDKTCDKVSQIQDLLRKQRASSDQPLKQAQLIIGARLTSVQLRKLESHASRFFSQQPVTLRLESVKDDSSADLLAPRPARNGSHPTPPLQALRGPYADAQLAKLDMNASRLFSQQPVSRKLESAKDDSSAASDAPRPARSSSHNPTPPPHAPRAPRANARPPKLGMNASSFQQPVARKVESSEDESGRFSVPRYVRNSSHLTLLPKRAPHANAQPTSSAETKPLRNSLSLSYAVANQPAHKLILLQKFIDTSFAHKCAVIVFAPEPPTFNSDPSRTLSLLPGLFPYIKFEQIALGGLNPALSNRCTDILSSYPRTVLLVTTDKASSSISFPGLQHPRNNKAATTTTTNTTATTKPGPLLLNTCLFQIYKEHGPRSWFQKYEEFLQSLAAVAQVRNCLTLLTEAEVKAGHGNKISKWLELQKRHVPACLRGVSQS